MGVGVTTQSDSGSVDAHPIGGACGPFRAALITKNVAASVKLPTSRSRKRKAWSGDEARRFLESAWADNDPFYAAYVLVLVLGLRMGEVLGLTWDDVYLDNAELASGWQLQRVRRHWLHRETKTEGSDATLPLPAICVAALQYRRTQQQDAMAKAGSTWQGSRLVFTTRVQPCR
jgi:integrase